MKKSNSVRINGVLRRTVIDRDGRQRFPTNQVVRHLLEVGRLDLNQISVMEQNGQFPRKDVQQLYRLIGVSVDLFGTRFPNAKIDAPVAIRHPLRRIVCTICEGRGCDRTARRCFECKGVGAVKGKR